jgi:hypothetical protein
MGFGNVRPRWSMSDMPGQYIFFGGNERRICLRNLATAAAFFRLRFDVGFS